MLQEYKNRSITTNRFKQSLRPSDVTINTVPIVKGNVYLPVIRYEGLYYSKEYQSNYLGKFYFYEPESPFGINLGNFTLFANKYHTMRFFEHKLFGDFNEIELIKNGIVPNILSLYYLFTVANIRYFITSKEIPGNEVTLDNMSLDFVMTKFSTFLLSLLDDVNLNRIIFQLSTTQKELTSVITTELELDEYTIPILTIVKYYINGKPFVDDNNQTFIENYNGNLFAKADYLDQPIIFLARKYGYDCIILQREIGEYNIITEVVDCRENTNNISRIIPNAKTYKHPLVWTPDKQFSKFQ